ncbi:TetR/AcrR family transcriptional regulator [Kiloniella sp.]|uniref:TetR/AcrR family transcriptional regulator n=1 Tax=Kiloniella sp. TaxID=1938587 RepID=UPI003B01C013
MTLGRPREFDIDIALDQAMELFWTQGYEGTSLASLLSATGLSKSSLYKVFGSKLQLFEMAIERYSEKLYRSMSAELEAKPSGLAFIRDTLVFAAREIERAEEPRGCFISNSINEWNIRDQRLRQIIIDRSQTFEALFAKAIKRAQDEGDIPSNSDPKELAGFLFNSISGLRSSVKSKVGKEKLEKIVDITLSALH